MFKIVNSILLYYYFNVLALIVYPYIVIKSILSKNSTVFFERTAEYLILVFPLIMLFGILCLKYNFMFSAYLLLFYFGGYLFYIFFRQNNIEIDLKNVLILLCFLTIAESLAINTIILPSDLPNWPLNAEDTILYGHTSRGGYQFSSFYYIRPTGFGGNPSITSTLLISILVYLHNAKEDNLFINLVTFGSIILTYSGVGYMFLGIYFLFYFRALIISVFILLTVLIVAEFLSIQKLELSYYQFLIVDILQNVMWVVSNINIYEFVFGQVIPFESPIGGDFYWLYFFQWFGAIGILFYFLLISTNASRINFFPILILVISTIHYHTIFSIPGQMIFGYLLTRNNFTTSKNY
tara:strand:+ start:385 stop:1437 length:1053 start_codon:yes stop_codon:yes gene_type:complete